MVGRVVGGVIEIIGFLQQAHGLRGIRRGGVFVAGGAENRGVVLLNGIFE